jgi:hypothetical protein
MHMNVFGATPQDHVKRISVAGVLDESYSQLTPLSGVAVQARASLHRLKPFPAFVAWWAGMATPLSWLS